ncbi:DASH complex subunit DAD1 [Cryptococcus neoformans]|nr:DASH complex subunit DAD1 [Cryptococcus neoformans var. grubii]OXC60875.1 DASH complex subunit DAD1 [Cryptococcus neoformans var. grubii MW-RSA852]
MSLSRPSNAYDALAPSESFFEREKARLIEEISTNFEELMGNMNTLNRTLEQVYGVGREFTTVASLWGRFNTLIKEQQVSQSNTSPSMLIEYRRSSRLQQMWASLVQEVQTSLRAQARLLLDDPVVKVVLLGCMYHDIILRWMFEAHGTT